MDIKADPELIDKELEKDIQLGIFTLKTCFYMESLNEREDSDSLEDFLKVFTNKNKSHSEIIKLSKS